ncbi:Eco57I restriction-modification methylase domain-containing protein [Halorarum salinum]|uniref:site-specific DNA-methyltransferase (adenine-specific) n=2 Tax=Halorarum salinum TaxID=2743089 RepID=A0A7D5QDE2_9EURY|nr:Eco57I restriction-modification methylase domain-containing protein [Halobaculum salinum]
MSVRTPIEGLASIENGGDVIDYLLNSEGLNYSTFVEVPSGIKRNQGRNDWYEAHLVDENGDGIIRYIELEASGDSPTFSDLKRHLKRHGSPVNELFTVIAYRKSDEGPLTSPLNDDLTFLYIEEQFSSEDVEVTFDLNYFTVKRFGVEPAYLDYLDDLSVDSGQGRTSLEGDVEDVFSIREVTRNFYQDFGEIFREDLQDAIHGLKEPEENLNAYTRTVVNRVLFLLFIEEKGWLDGDVDYVENKYEEVAKEDDLHVYDDLFEPLFFEALSEEGTTESDRLGQIPFLNGGLFERKDIEEDVEIDEEFFDKLLSPEDGDDGEPEGFLRRYKISLRESNPSEQELVVDPEFIGRIFEMFMQEDERSEVGAFYTPKPITAYMTKNALKQHLLGQTDISHEEAVSLVSDHTAPDSLTEDQIEDVNNALRSATVLDPAVGSGAFIIAMLEELVAVSEALDDSTGDGRSRFQLKEEFIADTLYGVDIDAGGIELCKFRVWLHLMQDLDVDHDEFLDSNEEFALPNLGFKFFVGNSLVGEHDPTNVDAQQATLTGGLDSTLEEIHEVRTQYQTAHGDEKDRLAERLEELTDELDTQLAVEKSSWMTEVVEETDETFAWTLNIPEVILDGGFDIVIGNPPYEGQSQQDYIGELARFYDKKYDFYKTIPRMRHDLYQKFNIRGWELTRKGGVLSYITSNTFYTIGSKQTTRQLLQRNQLLDLLRANSDTFEATVEPAIFALQKRDPDPAHKFNYIDASETEIQEYRSFVRELDTSESDAERVAPLDLHDSSRGYRVQLQVYKDTLRSAFFEPTETNMRLHDQFMSRIKSLAEEWESELQDVTTLKHNAEKITQNHTSQLDTGDVSILGLLTLGGQGMTTDKNAKYMAFLEGTEEAEELADRNPDFKLNERNENEYKYLDKVITKDRVADPSNLTSEEQLNGIDSSKTATWVPIEKGFRQSDLYYKPQVEYINWSKDSLQEIQSHRNGILKNIDYYFEPGVFLSIGGFANLKARYTNNRAIDHTGNIFAPTILQKLSVKYLIGILNSEVPIHITENFINSTGLETADLRLIPIPIPTEEQRESVEMLVDRAIESQRGNRSESLESIQVEVEEIVEQIYQVDLDE